MKFLDYNGLVRTIANIKSKFCLKADLATVATSGSYNDLSNKPTITSPMTEITWSALKTLRDSSQLVPGREYRITDYACTTTQSNTQSAGHAFDIIVVADAVNKLNENARAIQHAGDTYFASSNLAAWRLKYCIDNDSNRFGWADTTNGKGVIWLMIDEEENVCGYDFKNMLFAPGAKTQPGTVDGVYYYTFSYVTGTNDATVADQSMKPSGAGRCKRNIIARHGSTSTNVKYLPCCVFRSTGGPTWLNKIGEFSCANIFGDGAEGNVIEDWCGENLFGTEATFNVLKTGCDRNVFGNGACRNVLEVYCRDNTFGNSFFANKIGVQCMNNTFGNGCQGNILGYLCKYNTFGNSCMVNEIGGQCQYIKFGNYGVVNKIGGGCRYIEFGSENEAKSYYRAIEVEGYNRYIRLNCTGTTSSSSYYRNVRITSGVNAGSPYKEITDSNVGQTFQTVYQPANSQVISV